jgi:Outer membrane protein beta-barrel domain
MKAHGVGLILAGLLGLMPAAVGQSWEVGGAVGGGFYTSQTITNATAGNADAKIGAGMAVGTWLGFGANGRWAGEVRYNFQGGDLQLSSGSGNASFGSATHTMTYDFHYQFRTSEDKVRPYVAFGAGMKAYQGNGTEVASQPLSKIALLTKTTEVRPVASFGFGVKARIGANWMLRAEVHDYLSPFPTKVITPNTGSKVGGWMNDIVPMVGISYVF